MYNLTGIENFLKPDGKDPLSAIFGEEGRLSFLADVAIGTVLDLDE
jgi:hypothetical protein